MESLETSSNKGILGKTKDMVVEKLMGAEQKALAAISNAQNEVIDEIQLSKSTVVHTAESAKSLLKETTGVLDEVQESAKSITALNIESGQIVEKLKTREKAASETLTKTQATSKSIETLNSESKAHVKEVLNSKSEVKNYADEIGKFYGEIGDRKAELLDIKKNTTTELTEIKEGYSNSIGEFEQRTNNIVNENESLNVEIKSHLQRAVGASLFSAFGTRKDKVVSGKWIWFGVLLASLAGGIYWVSLIVEGLKGDLDAAFVIRTLFAFPIGYFIYFCTKQYDRERRTEEEYAFKAAVSVSLKPFHDLLVESKDKEIDTDFMKALMQEIFDNPVSRLFSENKTSSRFQLNQKGLGGEHLVEPPVNRG